MSEHAAKIHARDKIHGIMGDLINKHPTVTRELIDCLAGHLQEQEWNLEKARINKKNADDYFNALASAEREVQELKAKIRSQPQTSEEAAEQILKQFGPDGLRVLAS